MSDNFFLQHGKAVMRYIMQHEAQAANPIPIMYRAHDPILHTEENGYWCDNPSCPCRQERSYCERYVKVEVSCQ